MSSTRTKLFAKPAAFIAQMREEAKWSGEQLTLFLPNGRAIRVLMIMPNVGLELRYHLFLVNNTYWLPATPFEARMMRYLEQVLESDPSYGPKAELTLFDRAVKSAAEKATAMYPGANVSELEQKLTQIVAAIIAVGTGAVKQKALGIPVFELDVEGRHLKGPIFWDLAIAPIQRGTRRVCNADCFECYADESPLLTIGPGEHELTTLEWKRIIDIAIHNGGMNIVFTGGEPTTRADLVELVKHARKAVTYVNTNGWLLARRDTSGKTLAQRLAAQEVDLDLVQITFMSSNPNTHNALMGHPRAFQMSTDGIKAAVEAGLFVSVNIPLSGRNKDLRSTLTYLASLGVRWITVSGLISAGNATQQIQNGQQLKPDEFSQILQDAVPFARGFGMSVEVNSPGVVPEETLEALKMNKPRCSACEHKLCVGPKGDVLFCQSAVEEGDSLGNLLKTSLKKIWESQRRLNIRDEHAGKSTCFLAHRSKREVK